MTEALLIAIISASSVIFAATITCVGVIIGANKIADKKKLQQNLMRAYIRADEPTREGAYFTGDTTNNFPLQSLGLTKTDVNNIVNQTVGIPLYYKEKSRSGYFMHIQQKKRNYCSLERRRESCFFCS